MPTIRKRGGSYQLCYFINGKERRLSISNLIKEHDYLVRDPNEVQLYEISFRLFAKRYIEWREKEYPSSNERVTQIINQHLIPCFKDEALMDITRIALEDYKHARLKLVKAATVAKELRTMQAIMNKACEWGFIDANHLKGVKAPRDLESKPPSFYSLDQVKMIYDSSNSYHRDIWRLYFNTGMRASEGMNLKWENITDKGIYILSTNQHRTKSGKYRVVPHNQSTRLALANLSNTHEYVLPRIHAKSLGRAFKKTVKRCNLPGSLHWTRHTYASHLIMSGEPIRKVQHLLGHSSVTTTEQYSHLAPEHIREIAICF